MHLCGFLLFLVNHKICILLPILLLVCIMSLIWMFMYVFFFFNFMFIKCLYASCYLQCYHDKVYRFILINKFVFWYLFHYLRVLFLRNSFTLFRKLYSHIFFRYKFFVTWHFLTMFHNFGSWLYLWVEFPMITLFFYTIHHALFRRFFKVFRCWCWKRLL